jgi:hypothetical protein
MSILGLLVSVYVGGGVAFGLTGAIDRTCSGYGDGDLIDMPKPLPPRDDDAICRLKREAKMRGEHIAG